jgi:hypothetical protein
VDHQAGLLRAWLEGEGERQRRPVPLSPQAGHPAVRGWVHVRVCVWGGALAAGLSLCWLATAWHRAAQAVAVEQLQCMEIKEATGEVKTVKAGPGAAPGRGGR